ncbi:nodulation protein NfeD [Myxococcota bacterium]|nr:nodulation protein NfeD [Myxococcota bacterium]MCZ7618855.1 nodulation protein NfeD [Myxococcota bacterium]
MSTGHWGVAGAVALLLTASSAAAGHVNVIRVAGTINPASSSYIQKSIERSEADGAAALLLELDTPGGLVSSTKDIIQAILNADVAVVVYVSPQGAWAGSAGTFITISGHVAAMAPGTSIGAAHPVGVGTPGGGGEREKEGAGQDVAAEKAENLLVAFIESIATERERNVEWAAKAVRESVAITADEALKLNVIDLVAQNRGELMTAIDGRTVKVAGVQQALAVRDAELRIVEMSMIERFLHVLASPDVAVLLLMAGLLGLYLEFSNPGLILPGVAGAACLILGLIALQILPFSWLGLILFMAGIGLLIAELFVGAYGVLFALGIGCMLVGGVMIFDVPEVSGIAVSFWSVLVPAVTGVALFGALVVFGLGRTMGRPQTAGTAELVGLVGRTEEPLTPEGRVFVRGEYWSARADEPVSAGDRIEVVAVEGMRLRVRKASERA